MKTGSRFLELEPGETVKVKFDDESLALPLGANLAASLLAAGVNTFRLHPVSGQPRAPFCLMGACFECLVKIDGVSMRACMQVVTENMVVTSDSLPRGEDAGN